MLLHLLAQRRLSQMHSFGSAAPKAYAEGLGGSDQLEFVDAPPSGGDLAQLAGIASSFAPNYAPDEIFEIATKLYKKAKNL
jgi:hypothetical protein